MRDATTSLHCGHRARAVCGTEGVGKAEAIRVSGGIRVVPHGDWKGGASKLDGSLHADARLVPRPVLPVPVQPPLRSGAFGACHVGKVGRHVGVLRVPVPVVVVSSMARDPGEA